MEFYLNLVRYNLSSSSMMENEKTSSAFFFFFTFSPLKTTSCDSSVIESTLLKWCLTSNWNYLASIQTGNSVLIRTVFTLVQGASSLFDVKFDAHSFLCPFPFLALYPFWPDITAYDAILALFKGRRPTYIRNRTYVFCISFKRFRFGGLVYNINMAIQNKHYAECCKWASVRKYKP